MNFAEFLKTWDTSGRLLQCVKENLYWMFFNPLVPCTPFLYPLKTLENLQVFWCFQGLEKACIGNKWVNYVFTHVPPHVKVLFLMFVRGLLVRHIWPKYKTILKKLWYKYTNEDSVRNVFTMYIFLKLTFEEWESVGPVGRHIRLEWPYSYPF